MDGTYPFASESVDDDVTDVALADPFGPADGDHVYSLVPELLEHPDAVVTDHECAVLECQQLCRKLAVTLCRVVVSLVGSLGAIKVREPHAVFRTIVRMGL